MLPAEKYHLTLITYTNNQAGKGNHMQSLKGLSHEMDLAFDDFYG
jgi:hypothetical protein